jgi:hypothetical protein
MMPLPQWAPAGTVHHNWEATRQAHGNVLGRKMK